MTLGLSACSNAEPEESPDTAPAVLEPGTFQSPLVKLRRLQGTNGHLHVDEVKYRASDAKLFQCSYTFGVMDAENPANLSYLAQGLRHTVPDDERTPGCIHLDWDDTDESIVYVSHRGNIRNPTFLTGWDISKTDPEDPETMVPEQLPVLQEPGVSYEGIDVVDGNIYVALKENGMGVYRRDPETNIITRTASVGDLGSTWDVRVTGDTAVLTDLDGNLVTVDVSDPAAPKKLGSVATGGVARGLDVDGQIAFVAAGSEGLVLVDISDPAKPVVAAKADTPGTAIRVDASEGYATVADWNDTRVFDVSDPAAPSLVGALRLTTDVTFPDDEHPPVTARTLGVAANGKDIYVGNWWVNYAYRLNPDRQAPFLAIPEDVNLLDLGPVAAGESVTVTVPVKNEGTAPLTLINNWTSNPEFSVSPKQAKIEPGDQVELQVSLSPTSDEKVTSLLNIMSDDPQQPVRSAFLVANQSGLGVGKELPTTKIATLDGGEWDSSQVEGNVKVLAYFATF
jgi:hypothetical protein